MRTYCRAYRIGELRAFDGWAEPERTAELDDDEVVYLWDDLTVVLSPVSEDQGLIHADVTPRWREFCRRDLSFHADAS